MQVCADELYLPLGRLVELVRLAVVHREADFPRQRLHVSRHGPHELEIVAQESVNDDSRCVVAGVFTASASRNHFFYFFSLLK